MKNLKHMNLDVMQRSQFQQTYRGTWLIWTSKGQTYMYDQGVSIKQVHITLNYSKTCNELNNLY